jgi:hypothetical protein
VKTFEEAFIVVVPSCPASDRAQTQQIMERAQERGDRLRELLDEIREHERLKIILGATLAGSCCPFHALLNAFSLGLQVGMEMEMSETGGVEVE